MENKLIKKSGCSKTIYKEVTKKLKNLFFLLVFYIILIFLILFAYIHKFKSNSLVIAFITTNTLFLLIVFYFIGKNYVIRSNISKNAIEIKKSCICVTYTNNICKPQNAKYKIIDYDQINKIEIKEPNVQSKSFYNLYIYYTSGIIKLSTESTNEIILAIKKAYLTHKA